jgi:alginate O-acetyltransferase complex protein AlgI
LAFNLNLSIQDSDVMQVATGIAWGIGLLAFVGLVVISHQEESKPSWVWAALAIAASAALVFVMTSTFLALGFLGLNVLLVLGTWYSARTRLWWGWVIVLVGLLIVSKLPFIQGSGGAANPAGLGLALWLGFSYLAFRLIHFTVDAHAGRAGDATLPEVLVYVLHPASLVAGPIDRIRPSAKAQRDPGEIKEDVHQGLWRVVIGVFVKFVIANPVYAFIARYDMARNPDQSTGMAWLWLLAYSVYILADFAAYSDIAIGLGRIAGLRLPENFKQPYRSPSLSVFWQRWHISLSFWLRDYIFFPIARGLQKGGKVKQKGLVQFIAHMTTMITCGLWHGLSGGFLAWGAWHGLGLFVSGQYAASRPRQKPDDSLKFKLRQAVSITGTYAFVTLGWVFFAADFPTALRIFGRLFGVS